MATTIIFERKSGVYLPEIVAYCDFLKHANQGVTGLDSAMLGTEGGLEKYDVHWRFMGLDHAGFRSAPNAQIVHEYGSLSVPPWAHTKNRLKRMMNVRPDQRVFLNEGVAAEMGFNDDVPTHFRDMGIDERFFTFSASTNPEYDFVYCGSLYRGTAVLDFLEAFSQRHDLGKLLVIGECTSEDRQRLTDRGNIFFTGRLPYAEVPATVCKARYALNLMPDAYPYNMQTSTKLLEYCALNMPIITTDYIWVSNFEKQRQGRFFRLPAQLDALSRKNLDSFAFVTPSVNDLLWSEVIRKSGIFNRWLSAGPDRAP